jgi:hypothetical protein
LQAASLVDDLAVIFSKDGTAKNDAFELKINCTSKQKVSLCLADNVRVNFIIFSYFYLLCSRDASGRVPRQL